MFYLHDKYCIVPADKASHNVICVCKLHYKVCLIKELSTDDSRRYTYIKCAAKTLTKEDNGYNQRSVCIHLEFPPNIKSWMISLYSTVYLNCMRVNEWLIKIWILNKKSRDMLDYIQPLSLSLCNINKASTSLRITHLFPTLRFVAVSYAVLVLFHPIAVCESQGRITL